MKNIFLFLTLSLFSFSCTDDDSAPVFEDAPVHPDKSILLQLVNNARSEAQVCEVETLPAVPGILWSNTLETVAQKHCDDMDAAQRLSHRGTDGSFLDERLEREGYVATVWAENLAQGSLSEKEVMELWMDSPGHCENIMNAQVLEMGVATQGSFWTMVLAKK